MEGVLITAIVFYAVIILSSFFVPKVEFIGRNTVDVVEEDMSGVVFTLEDALEEYYPEAWEETKKMGFILDLFDRKLRHRRDTDAMAEVFNVLDDSQSDNLDDKKVKMLHLENEPEDRKKMKEEIRDVVLRELVKKMYPNYNPQAESMLEAMKSLAPEYQFYTAVEWDIVTPTVKLTAGQEEKERVHRHGKLNEAMEMVNHTNVSLYQTPQKSIETEMEPEFDPEIYRKHVPPTTSLYSRLSKKQLELYGQFFVIDKSIRLPPWKHPKSALKQKDSPPNNTNAPSISYFKPPRITVPVYKRPLLPSPLTRNPEYIQAYNKFQKDLKENGGLDSNMLKKLNDLQKFAHDVLERVKLKGLRIKHQDLWNQIFDKRNNFVGSTFEFREQHADGIDQAQQVCKEIIKGYGNLPSAKPHDDINPQEPAVIVEKKYIGFELERNDPEYFEKMSRLLEIQEKYRATGNHGRFFSDYHDYIVYLQDMQRDLRARAYLKMLKGKRQYLWEEIYQHRDYFIGTDDEFEKKHKDQFIKADILNDEILNYIGEIAMKENLRKIAKEKAEIEAQQKKKEEEVPLDFDEYQRRQKELHERMDLFIGTDEEFNNIFRKDIEKLARDFEVMTNNETARKKQCKENTGKVEEDNESETSLLKDLKTLKDEQNLSYMPRFIKEVQNIEVRRMLYIKRQALYDEWKDLIRKGKEAGTEFLQAHSNKLKYLDDFADMILEMYGSLSTSKQHQNIPTVIDEDEGKEHIDPKEIKRLRSKFPDFAPFDAEYLQKFEKLISIRENEKYRNNTGQFFQDYMQQINALIDQKRLFENKVWLKVNHNRFKKNWEVLFQKRDNFKGTIGEFNQMNDFDLEQQSLLGREILRLCGTIGDQMKKKQVNDDVNRKRRSLESSIQETKEKEIDQNLNDSDRYPKYPHKFSQTKQQTREHGKVTGNHSKLTVDHSKENEDDANKTGDRGKHHEGHSEDAKGHGKHVKTTEDNGKCVRRNAKPNGEYGKDTGKYGKHNGDHVGNESWSNDKDLHSNIDNDNKLNDNTYVGNEPWSNNKVFDDDGSNDSWSGNKCLEDASNNDSWSDNKGLEDSNSNDFWSDKGLEDSNKNDSWSDNKGLEDASNNDSWSDNKGLDGEIDNVAGAEYRSENKEENDLHIPERSVYDRYARTDQDFPSDPDESKSQTTLDKSMDKTSGASLNSDVGNDERENDVDITTITNRVEEKPSSWKTPELSEIDGISYDANDIIVDEGKGNSDLREEASPSIKGDAQVQTKDQFKNTENRDETHTQSMLGKDLSSDDEMDKLNADEDMVGGFNSNPKRKVMENIHEIVDIKHKNEEHQEKNEVHNIDNRDFYNIIKNTCPEDIKELERILNTRPPDKIEQIEIVTDIPEQQEEDELFYDKMDDIQEIKGKYEDFDIQKGNVCVQDGDINREKGNIYGKYEDDGNINGKDEDGHINDEKGDVNGKNEDGHINDEKGDVNGKNEDGHINDKKGDVNGKDEDGHINDEKGDVNGKDEDEHINDEKGDVNGKDEHINDEKGDVNGKDEDGHINDEKGDVNGKDEDGHINDEKGDVNGKDEDGHINDEKGDVNGKDEHINDEKGDVNGKDEDGHINGEKGDINGKDGAVNGEIGDNEDDGAAPRLP